MLSGGMLSRPSLMILKSGLVDRRSLTEVAAAVSRSHRATPELILDYLYETEIKTVCEEIGIASNGRRKKLIRRLLRSERASSGDKAASRDRLREPRASTRKTFLKENKQMNGQENAETNQQEQIRRLPEPPPGMRRVTNTELVWPGKYMEDGTLKEVRRVSLPFQVIETVNQSRATREMQKAPRNLSLFDIYDGREGNTFEDGWRNKLIWGDNSLVMSSLLQKFAGKIDLIYIDPPFATGADFSFSTEIGDGSFEIEKEQSILEEKVYRDTWGRGLESYLDMISSRLLLMRDLLSEQGSIYVHLDWHLGHYVKAILDELFGSDNFRNEIIREKCNPKNYTSGQFGNIHDCIFLYTKGSNPVWNRVFLERSEEQVEKDFPLVDAKTGVRYKTAPLHAPGTRYGSTGKPWRGISLPPNYHWRYVPETLDELDGGGHIEWSSTGNPRKKVYADESEGYSIQDIWFGMKDPGQQWYATEKPESLLERIVRASSREGSIVADFFCGSGTTLLAAERQGRRWIGCDLGRFAIHTTRKRFLDIENCRPFEILNLGKYERQYWQGMTFGEKSTGITEQAIYEYLAFVLKLYGAQPVAGFTQLHGRKGRGMVHIGAVDAPVTIDEINASIAECLRVKQAELHVLGWEWEMGLNNLMIAEAKKQGAKLLMLQIPREVMEQQAVDKGDVRFFELAYLEVEIKQPKKLTATVALKDFVIPNTELIPEEVRSKVKKWSDYIDYWAVDWDFQNDTFMQGWVTYRTRKDRSLPLTSDPHTYEKHGKYRILVKVIDIFGNDTSQAFEVTV